MTDDPPEDASAADAPAAGDPATEDAGQDAIRRAVREIRTEGRKATALHALVDAVAVALLVNLALRLLAVSGPAVGPVPGRVAVAVACGVGVGAVEAAWRLRRYTLRRFEAENPQVAEALRTARDAAAAGATTAMARRLYADVRERLRATSAAGFVDTRWLTVSLLLLVAASVGTVHVAASGFDVAPSAPDPEDTSANAETTVDADTTGTDLRDGEEVLDDTTDVSSGTDDVEVNLSRSRGSEGSVVDDTAAEGETTVDPAVSAQDAGYDPADRPEDAALVREYNVRLRETTDD